MDLFSGRRVRVRRAVRALLHCPQNNLRLSVDHHDGDSGSHVRRPSSNGLRGLVLPSWGVAAMLTLRAQSVPVDDAHALTLALRGALGDAWSADELRERLVRLLAEVLTRVRAATSFSSQRRGTPRARAATSAAAVAAPGSAPGGL